MVTSPGCSDLPLAAAFAVLNAILILSSWMMPPRRPAPAPAAAGQVGAMHIRQRTRKLPDMADRAIVTLPQYAQARLIRRAVVDDRFHRKITGDGRQIEVGDQPSFDRGVRRPLPRDHLHHQSQSPPMR